MWSARTYAIIIDSGSTGSRLLAFTFRRGAIDQQLQLEDELWEEVKPGKYSGSVCRMFGIQAINTVMI